MIEKDVNAVLIYFDLRALPFVSLHADLSSISAKYLQCRFCIPIYVWHAGCKTMAVFDQPIQAAQSDRHASRTVLTPSTALESLRLAFCAKCHLSLFARLAALLAS